MTLLSVVRDVCSAVGVLQPTSVFSGITGNRTMQEMLALANEIAQRIAYDSRDWTTLKKTTSFLAGTGATIDPNDLLTKGCDVFTLPANYKRMLLTSNVYRSTLPDQHMNFVPDTDVWLNHRINNYNAEANGEWTLIGDKMHIYPALTEGQIAYFAYLDKNCINLAGGGRGDLFQDDLDSFALSERVLKLGMTWQWKAHKGSPYAEDVGTYGDALTYEMGHDSPAPIIVGGGYYANRWG